MLPQVHKRKHMRFSNTSPSFENFECTNECEKMLRMKSYYNTFYCKCLHEMIKSSTLFIDFENTN